MNVIYLHFYKADNDDKSLTRSSQLTEIDSTARNRDGFEPLQTSQEKKDKL